MVGGFSPPELTTAPVCKLTMAQLCSSPLLAPSPLPPPVLPSPLRGPWLRGLLPQWSASSAGSPRPSRWHGDTWGSFLGQPPGTVLPSHPRDAWILSFYHGRQPSIIRWDCGLSVIAPVVQPPPPPPRSLMVGWG